MRFQDKRRLRQNDLLLTLRLVSLIVDCDEKDKARNDFKFILSAFLRMSLSYSLINFQNS